ncbi:hypothetical protein, partial [Paracoccus benzoatiresistens]
PATTTRTKERTEPRHRTTRQPGRLQIRPSWLSVKDKVVDALQIVEQLVGCCWNKRSDTVEYAVTLADDPEELRAFAARLLAEIKAQAILIEKLIINCPATGHTDLAPLPRLQCNCNLPWRSVRLLPTW